MKGNNQERRDCEKEAKAKELDLRVPNKFKKYKKIENKKGRDQ